MSLSDKVIRDAKAKTSVYRLRDANVVCRGFGVTIAPSGSKTFFCPTHLRWMANGSKSRWAGIQN
jgi:hypothetical protein